MQVSQEASVRSQLCATALTPAERKRFKHTQKWLWLMDVKAYNHTWENSLEINVGFVMMPHVFHEFLHVWEGAVAAGTRTQQDLP